MTDPGQPRLLLLLVIDQLRYDYLIRFRPLFESGFEYLLDRGISFTDAHQNHANTVTGPGHASLATGTHPRRSGIIGNNWYDPDEDATVYCCEGTTYWRSPENLLVSTLPDWIKAQSPQSRVFTAGGKDRSAILMGGHDADRAYWYDDDTGEWVTSGYYTSSWWPWSESEPEWLEEFHAQRLLESYFGTAWEPWPVDAELLETLDIEAVDEGIYQRRFPYPLGGPSLIPGPGFYSALWDTPLVDLYLVRFAEALIANESLGTDEHIDFLGLGLHTLDSIGHDFGPNSREVVDTMLRLDAWLGELFEFIDSTIGLENVVVALSADHGVMTLPEYRQLMGLEGERMDVEDILCFQGVRNELARRHGDEEWVLRALHLNEAALNEHGLDPREFETEVAGLLEQCASIAKVWTRGELEAPTGDGDWGPHDRDPYFYELFFNSFNPDRSPDLLVQFEPFFLDQRSRGTTHGSPYQYDTRVPLIVLVPGLQPAEISERVNTVDLAPTLATLLGIEAPDDLDGIDHTELIESTRPTDPW